jgi:regulator of protease activity HflC (stomatin/prohibitin superfamily)
MVFFVIGIILLVVAVLALIGAFFAKDKVIPIGILVVAGALGGIAIISQTFYSQDTGEASVLVDVSGNIAGQEITPGFHGKAPWQSVKTFNVRNQNVSYIGDGNTDYNGGSAKGPSITAIDSDGVSSEVNINVRYSITPAQVTTIYKQYKDESAFLQNYVTLTIQGAIRKVPNTYTTLDLITKQGQVQTSIQTALQEAFEGSGVTIDNVSLQNIEPPKSIKERYADAQAAQINVTKEKAKLQATQVSAQQQVVQAKAQAEANAELSKGLNQNVLTSRYIDALKEIGAKGNLVVVPAGSNPNIYTGKK